MLGATGFLLDGYPREESQASSFESDVRRGTCCISYVLDDAEMLRRMRGRAETSGRSDDNNEATMAERINVFRKHAQPVLNYFKGKGKLIQVCLFIYVEFFYYYTRAECDEEGVCKASPELI